jgi:predicted nucleic acid-binding protein
LKYWDSSAIVPLLLTEVHSARAAEIYQQDSQICVWCITPVEVWSAIAASRRSGKLGSPDVRRLRTRLEVMERDWAKMSDVTATRGRVRRILDTHPLKPADALQLAAALHVVQDRPELLPFVTFDRRLAEAAEIEGFRVEGSEEAR